MTELRQRQPRERNDRFLAFLREQPCCVCGSRYRVEAAHLRMADPTRGKRETGKGEKPSDKFCVPLCASCHREAPDAQHRMNEAAFWKLNEINPFVIAAYYYAMLPHAPPNARKKRNAKRATKWAKGRKIQNRGFQK